MPKSSKKLQILKLIQYDCTNRLFTSRDSDETSMIIDESMIKIFEIMRRRYLSCRIERIKSTHWYDAVFPYLEDEDFINFVRMDKCDFELVLSMIANDPTFTSSTRKQIPVKKQLAVALWRFGHNGSGASYHEVGHRFGVGTSGSIIRITKRVIQAILGLKRQTISWPKKQERENLSQLCLPYFPGLIGFVDGSHVNLEEAPAIDYPEDYFSRKQRYGLHLQLISDFNLKIRHMKVGRTASTHDAKVFRETDLCANPARYFANGQWLAGDSAYRLTENLLTPFRKNSTIGTAKTRKQFNKAFSSKRVKIEQVFGILKEKWSSLKELRVMICDRESHIYACQWIEACCILYNITKLDFERYWKDYDCDEQSYEDQILQFDTNIGENKRRMLFENFLRMRSD